MDQKSSQNIIINSCFEYVLGRLAKLGKLHLFSQTGHMAVTGGMCLAGRVPNVTDTGGMFLASRALSANPVLEMKEGAPKV